MQMSTVIIYNIIFSTKHMTRNLTITNRSCVSGSTSTAQLYEGPQDDVYNNNNNCFTALCPGLPGWDRLWYSHICAEKGR